MMKLLVVDDSESTLRLLKQSLHPLGAETDTAQSGLEAVTLLEGRKYDLVVTDLLMPLGSGFDIIDTLAQRNPRTPLLVCSAYVTQAVRERVRSYGPAEIVSKPFTAQKLLEAAQRLTNFSPGETEANR